MKKIKYFMRCFVACFSTWMMLPITALAAETEYRVNPNITFESLMSGVFSVLFAIMFAYGTIQAIIGIISLIHAAQEPERGGYQKAVKKILIGLLIMSLDTILVNVGLIQIV